MNFNSAGQILITGACQLAEKNSVCLYAKGIDDYRDESEFQATR